MGMQQDQVIPHERRLFVERQGTYDTPARATSAGAVKIKNFTVEYDQARTDRNHNRATQGRRGAVSGEDSVKWTLEKEVIPSGVAGTPPDEHELREAIYGQETIVGATSVTYAHLNTQTVLAQTITDHLSTFLMWMLVDAWVTGYKLSASGSDPITETFTGGCRRLVMTGASTLDAEATDDTEVTIRTADALKFEADSIVQIGAGTNGGAGFMVESRDGADLTLEAAATAADDAAVIPFSPAETIAGRPLSGIEGTISVMGAERLVTGWEYEVNRNHKIHGGNYGQVHVADVNHGMREVKGTVSFRCGRDTADIIAQRKNGGFGTVALTIVLGGAAGRTVTIALPQVELIGALSIEHSDDGEPSTVKLAWVADDTADNASGASSEVWT